MTRTIPPDLEPGPPSKLTLGQLARHHARTDGNGGRAVLIAGDWTATWPEIDAAADRLAAFLTGTGIEPGSRVGLLLPNCGPYVEVIFGVARAGMVSVPISPRSVAREVEHCISFAEASALITTTDLLEGFADVAAAHLPPERIVTLGGATAGSVSYDEIAAMALDARDQILTDEHETCWMPFTSGTSGVPKAALVTHRDLIDHWTLVMREFDVRRDDTMLIAAPFYHSLGFIFALACLCAGGRVVMHAAFDPDQVLQAIERDRVTVIPAAPTIYSMLLGSPLASEADLSSMRTVISAGSPLLTSTKEGLLELFPGAGLHEFYGSTETGIVARLAPEDQRRKVRCVGKPVVGVDVLLIDDDGREVAAGEVGEIWKRGMLLGPSYFRNETATRQVRRGEWMTVGDLGTRDDEGYLYIVDRKKDMIISGGVNVYPSEIEEVLSSHPAVTEVAVIGISDERWGEVVTALVVAEREVSEAELMEHSKRELSPQKRPRTVDFVDELPKTASGKVLKRVLRTRYEGADFL